MYSLNIAGKFLSHNLVLKCSLALQVILSSAVMWERSGSFLHSWGCTSQLKLVCFDNTQQKWNLPHAWRCIYALVKYSLLFLSIPPVQRPRRMVLLWFQNDIAPILFFFVRSRASSCVCASPNRARHDVFYALSNWNKFKFPKLGHTYTRYCTMQKWHKHLPNNASPVFVCLRACLRRLWYDNSGMQKQASASLS